MRSSAEPLKAGLDGPEDAVAAVVEHRPDAQVRAVVVVVLPVDALVVDVHVAGDAIPGHEEPADLGRQDVGVTRDGGQCRPEPSL